MGLEVVVKGEKGELKREFKYPYVEIKMDNNKVLIHTKRFTQRQKKIINTFKAHINNMIKGVNEGFKYLLRGVYAKFPMTIELKDNSLTLKNFLGEKKPRVLKVLDGVNVKVNGLEIEVSGIDKERCGEMAAQIEQMTKINHLDRRVIQDGVYIIEKPHRRYSD